MNWPLRSLDELGFVSRGRSRHRPRDAEHLYDGPYPFIQTADVKHSNLYITKYNQTYSDAGLAQSKLWEAGTLCITIAANIADTAILSFDSCFPDSIIGFIPNPQKADARFIKYLFDAMLQKRFQQFTQGAAQDNLSQAKLLSLRFPVPDDVKIQARIADILASYDTLIENNLRRMSLLGQSMQLLYREWFVYFRFPDSEHNLKESEEIPAGWKYRRLVDIAYITMGQSPASKYYNIDRDGLPFHQGVSNFGDRFVDHKVYCKIEARIAEPGDILCSVRAPVGRLNYTLDRIVIGRGLSAIRSFENHQSFLYYQLRNHFFKEDMIGGGAIFAAVTKNDIENQMLLCPAEDLIRQFEQYSKPIDEQVKNLHQQNIKLKQASDILLPRLINGEIPV